MTFGAVGGVPTANLLDRSPFVKNGTQITLVDGVVQKVTITRPSIILGIVGVPKTILEALVPLPH